jgi:hypothetical protein
MTRPRWRLGRLRPGCPQATFFHRAGWQRMLQDVFRHGTHFLLRCAAGASSACCRWRMSRACCSAARSPACRLRLRRRGGRRRRGRAALEARAQALAQQLGVQHLELRNLAPRHADWPEQDLYVTFRKPILPDEEANMLAIPRKQRAMVRKGIKNGLTSEIDDGDRFFALYADNVHRHGTPAMPKRYFEALRREFGADCEVLTVSGPDGRPLSSVMSFYFRDEVLPYYAGDDEAARDLAANDFKYWELMRRACARGSRCSTTAAASRARARSRSRRTGASSRRRCTTSTASTSAMRCRRTTPATPSTSC